MKNQAVTKFNERMPAVFENLFKPWNDLFEDRFLKREMNVPAVNIAELNDHYLLSLSAAGLKKTDFNIDVDGNVLTISSEKKENKEEKDGKYTRKEYNYSSFSRSFTLPEGTDKDKIAASYEDGVLNIKVPREGQIEAPSARQIAVN